MRRESAETTAIGHVAMEPTLGKLSDVASLVKHYCSSNSVTLQIPYKIQLLHELNIHGPDRHD